MLAASSLLKTGVRCGGRGARAAAPHFHRSTRSGGSTRLLARPFAQLADVDDDADAAKNDAPPRIVTAASLFDGHDASINVMRRLIQAGGAEVIHLAHDRSALDVVNTVIQVS